MPVFALLLACGLFVLAFFLLRAGVRGLAIAKRVIGQPTIPVARIAEGPVEVAGRVVPIGDPVMSASGQRCVAVKTTISGRRGTGKKSTSKGQNTALRVAPSRLTDRTGTCRLDLESCELVGAQLTSEAINPIQLVEEPWAFGLVPADSDNITIEETLVPEGALVLVSGEAAMPEPAPGGGGYRDATIEWQVSGTPQRLLVMSVGSQGRLLARALVPAILILGAGTYAGGLGALIVAIVLG